MATNLKSVYNMCQLAHPLLKVRLVRLLGSGGVLSGVVDVVTYGGQVSGHGSIVNIGSVAGVVAIRSGPCHFNHPLLLHSPCMPHKVIGLFPRATEATVPRVPSSLSCMRGSR
jgi:NAD(P)-dependent dehydrogenase (short-subunit alcohol dehydrogenase family)